jgi:ATP-dependent RNA helicase DeaD
MGEGSVWFRASIGSRKNAEARWLLPMICRRGGIDKSDIGAIRIMDTSSEFEISARAAESFAAMIRALTRKITSASRLAEAPQGQPPRRRAPSAAARGRRRRSPERSFPRRARPLTANFPAKGRICQELAREKETPALPAYADRRRMPARLTLNPGSQEEKKNRGG